MSKPIFIIQNIHTGMQIEFVDNSIKNAKDRFISFIKTGGKEIQENRALFILVKVGTYATNKKVALDKKLKVLLNGQNIRLN